MATAFLVANALGPHHRNTNIDDILGGAENRTGVIATLFEGRVSFLSIICKELEKIKQNQDKERHKIAKFRAEIRVCLILLHRHPSPYKQNW